MEHNGCEGCSFESLSEHELPCIRCNGTKEADFYKKITWVEKIRTMTDEELAVFLTSLTSDVSDSCSNCDYDYANPFFCYKHNLLDCTEKQEKSLLLNWLQSDYEED